MSLPALPPTSAGISLADHPALAAHIAEAVDGASADNTRAAYEKAWRRFSDWCSLQHVTVLPAAPVTVAAYLSEAAAEVDEQGAPLFAANTLTVWLAAINHHHVLAGQEQPGHHSAVQLVMKGVRRRKGRPVKRAAPLLVHDATRIVEAMPHQQWPGAVAAVRDSMLVLVGLGAALRRSELSGLLVGNLSPAAGSGLRVSVEHSKTDQEGHGMVRFLPEGKHPRSCPVCAVTRWRMLLDAADAGQGREQLMGMVFGFDWDTHMCRPQPVAWHEVDRRPLLRRVTRSGVILSSGLSGEAVHRILRARGAAAGFPPEAFSGHSMRAGFVTEAFRAGADAHSIKRQTGHKSDVVLAEYDRMYAPEVNNAVTRLGF